MPIFALAATWAVGGNLVLYFALKRRGAPVTAWLAGVLFYTEITYFTQARQLRTRRMDLFAASIAVASVVAIIAAVALMPIL